MAKADPYYRLKLLIDTKSDRVLFAEADKSFVESLRKILCSGCVHQMCMGVGMASEFHCSDSWVPEDAYIITDDMVITPMSMLKLLNTFQTYGIKDLGNLKEVKATVTQDQMKRLAMASVFSKRVLTSVLLPCQLAPKMKGKDMNPWQKQNDNDEEDGRKEEDPTENIKDAELSKKRKAISEKAQAIRASQDLVHRSSQMGLDCLGYKLRKEVADPRTVTRPFVWTKGYLRNQDEEQEEIREYERTPEGQHSSGIHDDAIAHIFGPEHPGRVRGMGFGVTPSKVNVVCGASRRIQRKDAELKHIMRDIKAIQAAMQVHGMSIDEFCSTSERQKNTASTSQSVPAAAAASRPMPDEETNPQV